MTRDEAVKVVRAFGMQKMEPIWRVNQPQYVCDAVAAANAEDTVDCLMALGILKCEPPVPHSPQDNEQ